MQLIKKNVFYLELKGCHFYKAWKYGAEWTNLQILTLVKDLYFVTT